MEKSFPERKRIMRKRSIIIPVFISLCFFLVTGIWAISTIQNFYYEERLEEVRVLASGYAETLSIAMNAQSLLEQHLDNTLGVAGAAISNYNGTFDTNILSKMAKDLNVDRIFIYDEALVLSYASDGLHIGWVPEEGHPVRQFFESSRTQYIEDIRKETGSGIPYKFGYYRDDHNGIIQVAVEAEKIYELNARFDSQHLLNQFSQFNNRIAIAYLDEQHIIVSSTIPSAPGTYLDFALYKIPSQAGSFGRITAEEGNFMVLNVPINQYDESQGTLLLFYGLGETEKLILTVSMVIISTIFLVFMLESWVLWGIYKKNQNYQFIAYHDELTGLPNHRYFNEFVSESHATEWTCVMLNPRNFKTINILYGYTYGNKVLIHIAEVLSELQHRHTNLQAFRISDDRFVILMQSHTLEKQLEALISSLHHLSTQYQDVNSLDFSIGTASTKTAGHDPSLLIKQASIALQTTAEETFIQHYNNSMEESLLRRDIIEQELKRAIMGEEEILSLAFQPIVEARNTYTHGFEALARMESHKLGKVSPMEFITLAEQRNLMVPLGDKIIDLATDFLQTIQERFEESINVAINVSTLQIIEENFSSKIQELAEKKHIDLTKIELELTESLFSQDLNLIARRLKELRQLGVRISIDDFGTGFSSLSRLGSLEIDILKLDRLFVMALGEPSERGLVSDIISMAHHLGKKVVAEGVETAEQERFLEQAQCDLLQGYLFSKPLSPSEAIRHLEQEKAQNA
nr:bifunctional diguanylate cyclase/phosphodiesterase [uncultured Sphaerochaeta sp.]